MSTSTATHTSTTPSQFQSAIKKSVLAIIFFIITYVLLFVAVLICAAILSFFAYQLVVNAPHIVTIALGIGMVITAAIIVFFLIKFLFKSETIDKSHLREITRKEQPKLFAIIDNVVKSTNSINPGKVYLSADVNAMVSFQSNLWSMIFPVKKDLTIGLGLMNTNTVAEFEGILAHEFGHFNQDSMRLGSFVYNVNRIIHNMLFDNQGLDNFVGQLSQLSYLISIPMLLGFKIIQGVQYILGKVYKLVNTSYMAVSREMEFQADEIATLHAGKNAMSTSLLRLDLTSTAYNTALHFAADQRNTGKILKNIYPLQHEIMIYLGEQNDLELKNGLPTLTIEDHKKQSSSKVIFEDQWASHPTTIDRVTTLNEIQTSAVLLTPELAITLLQDSVKVQEEMTEMMLKDIPIPEDSQELSLEQSMTLYSDRIRSFEFPSQFQDLYLNLNPAIESIDESTFDTPISTLVISEENELIISEYNAIAQDIAIITQLTNDQSDVKSFDYDGEKYTRKQGLQLLEKLQVSEKSLLAKLQALDHKLIATSLKIGSGSELDTLRKTQEDYQKVFKLDTQLALDYAEASDKASFLWETLEHSEIVRAEFNFKKSQQKVNKILSELSKLPVFELVVTHHLHEEITKYLENERPLFNGTAYNESVLERLNYVFHHVPQVSADLVHLYKKKLLDAMGDILFKQS